MAITMQKRRSSAAARQRRRQTHRPPLFFFSSRFFARLSLLLLLLLLLSAAQGQARVTLSQDAPEPSSDDAPSSSSSALEAASSPSEAPKATTTTLTSSSPSPSPAPSPAASLPLCPSQGDPVIKIAAAPGGGDFSGTLGAGCTASFELDAGLCLSSSSPRRFLTLQARAGARPASGDLLAPMLLVAPASGPSPRAERAGGREPEKKREKKEKEKKKGKRTRRALLAAAAPPSPPALLLVSAPSPGAPPTFSYAVHPAGALADAAGLADGGGLQFVQTELRSGGNSGGNSSSAAFRVAVFAARVPQSSASPTGARRKTKKKDDDDDDANSQERMPFILSWGCDADPPCPYTQQQPAEAPDPQRHQCSGKGECRSLPSGDCSGGVCAFCDCAAGAGGRDCSKVVRELAVAVAGAAARESSSSPSGPEKEGVGFSSGSKGASSSSSSSSSSRGPSPSGSKGDDWRSRHTFGIRAPSSSSPGSPEGGGTLLLEMVRGSGAAASPLLTVSSSSPSRGAKAAASWSPSTLVRPSASSPSDSLASSADPALSPHLEYQAIVLRDVKPGERVYATVSGAEGASVGAVAAPSSSSSSSSLPRRREGKGDGEEERELPEMFDNDDNTDEEMRRARRQRQQRQQQQQRGGEQKALPSNSLVSSAADLLFGPSALAAATARASDPKRPSLSALPSAALPQSAATLFASSAALSEPDSSQPAYRLRATWAPPRSDSASLGPESPYLCPADCSGRGSCVADGECACSPGSGGWRCQGRALDVSPGQGAAGRLPVGGWAFFGLPRSPREGLTVRLDARGGGRPLLLARAGGSVAGPGAPDAPPGVGGAGGSQPPPPLTLQVASGTQLLRVSPEDSSSQGGVVLALYNAPAGTHFAGSPLVFAIAVAGSASDAAAAALLEGSSSNVPDRGGRFPSLRGLGPWAAVSVALAATALCAGLILIARAGVLLAYRRRVRAAAAVAADAETAAAIATVEVGDAANAAAAALGPNNRPLGPGLSEEAIAALPTRKWEGATAEKARRASSWGGGAAASVVHIVATAAASAAASAPQLSPSVSPSQMPKRQQQQQQRRETDEKENAAAALDLDLDENSGEDEDSGICCVVCCCEFSCGDELRILLPCRHEFHSSCVDAWLRGHASCPVCRRVPGGSGGSCGASAAASASEGAEVARTQSPPSPPRPPQPPPAPAP